TLATFALSGACTLVTSATRWSPSVESAAATAISARSAAVRRNIAHLNEGSERPSRPRGSSREADGYGARAHAVGMEDRGKKLDPIRDARAGTAEVRVAVERERVTVANGAQL